MNRPRLLIIVNDAAFFVSHRLPIAVGALKSGFEVAVAAPASSLAVKQIERENILFFDLPIRRAHAPIWEEVRAILAMWRLIGHFQPDLVHLVTAKPIIFGGLLCRIRRIPIIAAVSGLGHSFAFDDLKSRLQRFALLLGYRIALKRRRAIAIFQNQQNLSVFTSNSIIGRRHVMIRGSGADMAAFDPTPPKHGDLRVLMPARMLWTKGVGEFVGAARLLRARGCRARFILAGKSDPGNPANVSVEQLRMWHDEGVVEWIGYQADIAATLHQSDVVVLPSYYPEGLPKSLIDASAAGRPIVTTDFPGCRDAIVDGRTGLLCRPRDDVNLAEKIQILLSNELLRRSMGRAARAFAEREFAVEKVVEQHLACYEELLSDTRKNEQ